MAISVGGRTAAKLPASAPKMPAPIAIQSNRPDNAPDITPLQQRVATDPESIVLFSETEDGTSTIPLAWEFSVRISADNPVRIQQRKSRPSFDTE
jgi:hypothetical protein